MRAVFVDANDTLAAVTEKLRRAGDPPLAIHRDPDVKPDELPVVLGDAEIAIIDHTSIPTPLAAQCRGLKHVVFLGTGARSYMNPNSSPSAASPSISSKAMATPPWPSAPSG